MDAYALNWLRGFIDQSGVDIEQSQPNFHTLLALIETGPRQALKTLVASGSPYRIAPNQASRTQKRPWDCAISSDIKPPSLVGKEGIGAIGKKGGWYEDIMRWKDREVLLVGVLPPHKFQVPFDDSESRAEALC
jgi:hypothetical protein